MSIEKHNFVQDLSQSLRNNGYSQVLKSQSINIHSAMLKHRVLTLDEFDQLAGYAQEGDQQCRELTAIYSSKLVHSIASQHTTKYTFEYGENVRCVDPDLMQAGYVGVLKALPKWKSNKGHFVTFVWFYIRKYILRALNDTNNLIKIKGEGRRALAPKLDYLHIMYTDKCGNNPVTIEGFVAWLNENGHTKNVRSSKATVKDIERLLSVIDVRSLDDVDSKVNTKHKMSSESFISDTLTDNNAISPEEHAIHSDLKGFYTDALSILTPKQRQVIIVYYNLEAVNTEISNTRRITFSDVACILNSRAENKHAWNKTNCADLHSRALKRLRQYATEHNIHFTDFLDS